MTGGFKACTSFIIRVKRVKQSLFGLLVHEVEGSNDILKRRKRVDSQHGVIIHRP
jgi:hypothetical protein